MKIKSLLKIFGITMICIIIVIAILFTAARILTPRLAEFDQHIIDFLHGFIEHPVTLENVEAEWRGLGPVVYLNNLKVWDITNKTELASIGEAQIHLSVIDLLLNRGIVSTSIVIDNVETTLVQSSNGQLKVLGAKEQETQRKNDLRSTINWLLEHKKISLINLNINLHLANGQKTSIEDVSVVLTQEARKVRAELAGILYDTQQRGHLLLTAFLDPNYLIQEKLDGEVSILLDNADIPSWLGLWPKQLPLKIDQGRGYVSIKTTWSDNQLQHVQTTGALQQVAISSRDNSQGGTAQQINGHLDWQPDAGFASVESQQLELRIPKVYTQTTNISGISSTVNWQQTPDGLLMNGTNVFSLIDDGEVIIRGGVLLPPEKEKLQVELYAEAKTIPIVQGLAEYLPEKVLSPRLVQWLKESFLAGSIEHGQMVLRGPVYEFPFEQKQGKFEVVAQLVDTDLKFNSKWPDIKDLHAQLAFDGDELITEIQSGHIAGGNITQGKVSIPTLGKKGFDLQINGHLNGTAEQSIIFLKQSPLWVTLKEKLSPLNLQGPIEVDLDLELPINYPEKRKDLVVGGVMFKDAIVNVPNANLTFTNVNGRLAFDKKGVFAQNVSAKLFDQIIKVNLDTKDQKDLPSYTELVIDGKINMINIQQYYQETFWKDFQGVTSFVATLDWRSASDPKPDQMQIKSSLQGITIALPAPFGKTADQTRELTYTSIFHKTNKQLKLNYGNILNADVFISSGKTSTITHGTVGIQNKTPINMPANSVKIIGELPNIDVDLWKSLLERYIGDSSSTMTLPMIAAHFTTNKVHIFDKDFAVKYIDAKNQNNNWNISLSGPDAKGQVQIPNISSNAPINVQLTYLHVPKSTAEITKDMSPPNSDFPGFNININRLVLGDKDFGKVNVITQMGNNSLQIKKLTITKPSYVLSGTGAWKWPNQQSQTSFNGTIKTSNLGLMLKDMNISQGMIGGTGTSLLNLNWAGSPFTWSLDTLQGEIDIDWRNGRLVDVKPGLGRILSLFSVRSITRRLSLDFSDVFKKGFTFDKVTANLLFDKGVVSTDSGTVTSTSGKINFSGKAYIPEERLDLNVTVIPSVTTSLPIAAGVAIANPLVGAAVWAVGSVVSPVTNSLASFSYRVTGNWQDPLIEQVGSKSNKTTSTNSTTSKSTTSKTTPNKSTTKK